jgi:hypothetical protein
LVEHFELEADAGRRAARRGPRGAWASPSGGPSTSPDTRWAKYGRRAGSTVLRTLGASTIEKSTVSAAIAAPEPEPAMAHSPDALACSIDAMRNGEECEAANERPRHAVVIPRGDAGRP